MMSIPSGASRSIEEVAPRASLPARLPALLIREMQPIDLHRIRFARTHLPQGWRRQGKAMLEAGPCFTALHMGEVMAVAGLVLPWQGRAGTWCIIAEDFPRRLWPALHREVKARLIALAAELRLRRIEAEALSGWRQGALWLRKLGFRFETTMPEYGPDGSSHDRWIMRPAAEAAHG